MADDEKLKRERAGTYRTADGRFTVEQSSSGWVVLDAEQTDGLGLPLARGPFGTLAEARDAIGGARRGPAPVIDLPIRTDGRGRSRKAARSAGSGGSSGASPGATARDDDADVADGDGDNEDAPARAPSGPRAPARAPRRRAEQAVTYRELRAVDGPALRELWTQCGFRSLGDDDLSLARMARRNPGLLLVAAEGTHVIGSALGAWDGRRGWIYHVAVAESHRRRGIASRLVEQVETGLRDLGCPKVSVLVRDENDDGGAFWAARGYERGSRQYARELGDG